LDENHLIELLPKAEQRRLHAAGEVVPLRLNELACEPDAPARHVYFPKEGFISLLVDVPGHPSLEVGMVGREGMVGAELVLGLGAAPLRALVQGDGAALRIAAKPFRIELARSPALHRILLKYVQVRMTQLATSSACQRHHEIGARLARWLLMTQDRARRGTFHVTHEFLGYMLGVRRVGITTAAARLMREGLVVYRRGELTVLDRAGLERAACSCYAADEGAYRALL
jgi:CRP-like cAMP-binding protein